MTSGYDDMGPRIDLDGEPAPTESNRSQWSNPTRPPIMSSPSSSSPKGGGGKGLGVISIVLALVAIVMCAWLLMREPEPVPPPPSNPNVVPGATAERVAKLEKDVGDLMLRLVTLEKEIKAVASRAGSVTKLSQLSAKVAALQDRLDSLTLDRKISSLKSPGAAPAKPPAAENKQAPQQEAKPQAEAEEKPDKPEPKKLIYTVRSGDTLFTVAQRYKVSMSKLKKWNDLKTSRIMVGQKLVIYK